MYAMKRRGRRTLFSCTSTPSVEIHFHLGTEQIAKMCNTTRIKEPSVPREQLMSPFKHSILIDVVEAFLLNNIFHGAVDVLDPATDFLTRFCIFPEVPLI